MKQKNGNSPQNGEKGINFELLESYSPKDFILIKEPPKYLVTLPEEKFLFINIGVRYQMSFKRAKKLRRKSFVSKSFPKIRLVSTALVQYIPSVSDLSVVNRGLDSAVITPTSRPIQKEKKGFDFSLIWKGAIVFLTVLAFLFTSVLLNRLFERYYDEGVEVAKMTVETVVQIRISSGEQSMDASGVIERESGGKTYILTNCHVTGRQGELKIEVKPYGSSQVWIPAQFIMADPDLDLALISVSTTGFKSAKKASGDKTAEYGQTVYAVGNALGGGVSITKGIISQPRVNIPGKLPADPNQYFKNNDAIKFDAAVNKGNSGGGLFNKRGELVGIIFGFSTPTLTQDTDEQGDTSYNLEISYGTAYAVPIELVNSFLDTFFH